MPLPFGIYRADHVGSLLRAPAVLKARSDAASQTITASQLRATEDAAISTIVTSQITAGLRSITDGEFRRAYFHLDYLQHLSGVEIRGGLQSTSSSKEGFIPPRLVVTGKLSHPEAIQVEDFKFLESQIEKNGARGKVTTKVCIPSPTMVHFRGGRDTIDQDAYPELEPFFEDLARVYQEELRDLYDAGCRVVQLDDTNLAYLCDPGMRKEAEQRHGGDADVLTRQYAKLINKSIEKRPKDMTVGIHLCRGNHRSRWFAQGGYEPVAEVLFKELDADAYFLEFDDARSGDFKHLRHLPEHKVVVLGVMGSKKAELDDKQEIIGRLKEAAGYCGKGLDQLCLSHQCGFSSTMEGNELTEEQQFAKIRLEVEIAKEVWGDDLSK
jgi:5-methyltetrahydropteroyltriglutamate--homocysteine methyltransferase